MHHEQPTWPPTPEQITQWLDGFEQATHSAAPSHADRPTAPPLSAGGVALVVPAVAVTAVVVYGCVTGLLTVLHRVGPGAVPLVFFGLALLSAVRQAVVWGSPPWDPESSDDVDLSGPARWLAGWLSPAWSALCRGPAYHPHADAPPVTVLADAQGIEVRTGTTAQREAWLELMSVQDHGTALVLVFEYGEALRVPRDDAFEPVLSTARHIAAARAARQDAVLDDLEHGLSRAEVPVDADSGLSRLTAEEPAERDERLAPGG